MISKVTMLMMSSITTMLMMITMAMVIRMLTWMMRIQSSQTPDENCGVANVRLTKGEFVTNYSYEV